MVVDSGIAMREYGKTLSDFAARRRDQPTNEELQRKANKVKQQLAKRRLYPGREPTMTGDEIAAKYNHRNKAPKPHNPIGRT
jgi:hypothetical protein